MGAKSYSRRSETIVNNPPTIQCEYDGLVRDTLRVSIKRIKLHPRLYTKGQKGDAIFILSRKDKQCLINLNPTTQMLGRWHNPGHTQNFLKGHWLKQDKYVL